MQKTVYAPVSKFCAECQPKPANKYLRWNLLFTLIIATVLSSPFWMALIPYLKRASMELVVGSLIIIQFMWLVATFNAIRYVLKLRREFVCDECTKNDNNLEMTGDLTARIKHLTGLTLYKEPMDVLMRTIDSLARQRNAKKNLSVFVGLEEGTPDKENKSMQLRACYESQFERFIVTIHPKDLCGDIAGKCSNLNYAARKAVQILTDDPSYGLSEGNVELIVTTGDCDSIFPPKYFECLEKDYARLNDEDRHRTVWQSPLFYCINLHKSPFFVRVTGLLRSFFMMGFLIPWNINTMSIFSLSLRLYEDGEYTHPGYQMEDIIALIRWTLRVKQLCNVRALPVATMSGPTSGENFMSELYEWGRQIRRWTIGAAEVFHYFAVKSARLPISVSLPWAAKFLFYYGILLCVAPVYFIAAPLVTMTMIDTHITPKTGYLIPSEVVFNYILLGMIILQYFWLAMVFFVCYFAEKSFPDSIKDETSIGRSIFHWLMAYPTLLGCALIELWAFIEVAVRGKSACQHKASKKDRLVMLKKAEVDTRSETRPETEKFLEERS